MAVTIITEPTSVTPIGNGVQFELSLDASGNGSNLIYSIGYQLYDSNDDVITDLEQIAYTGVAEPIDFAKDIAPLIYTTIQQPGNNPQLDLDENFQKSFYLKYGQIEFDSDTCTTETSGVSVDSDEFMVINSAFQWWEEGYDTLASGQAFPLTDMAEGVFLNLFQNVNYIAPDQDLFLWVFRQPGVGNIRVSTVGFDKDNNVLYSPVVTQDASGAHIIDISPDVTTYPTLIKYRVDVRQDSSTPVKVYDFVIQDCGDAPIRELHWIGSLGGQESMVFDNVQENSNIIAQAYEGYTPVGQTPAQYGLNYGRSRTDSKARKQITMQKTIPNQGNQRKLLDGLFASNQHYVKFPIASGYTMCKFILQDGQYVVSDNKESILITVTGEIHLPINRV